MVDTVFSRGYKYVTNTGTLVPDTSEIKTQVENEFKAALPSLDVEHQSTPQYQLISAEITARTSVLENNALVANQINPLLANGIFLDAIIALTGGVRNGTKSTVTVTITSTMGDENARTFTRERLILNSKEGDTWELIENSVTLNNPESMQDSATTSVDFICTVSGAVTADVQDWEIPNEISIITKINNPLPAVVGANAASDVQVKRERLNQLSLNTRNTVGAIVSLVDEQISTRATTNIQVSQGSILIRENTTDSNLPLPDATNPVVTLTPHSVWCVIDSNAHTRDIAMAIYEGKSAGCSTYADDSNMSRFVSETLTDNISGQEQTINYNRPEPVNMLIRITVNTPNGDVPTQDIIDAVYRYINGHLENQLGFVINRNVSPFELSAAVDSQIKGIFIRNLEIALKPESGMATYQNTEYVINLNQVARIANPADILIVNQ